MFERFTRESREVLIRSQQEARDRADSSIASHHLLLAILGIGGPAADALAAHGLETAVVTSRVDSHRGRDAIDPEALRSVGIDVDEIRHRTERSFGPGALDEPVTAGSSGRPHRPRRSPGHIPFTLDARESLEQALRSAIRLGQREITPAHLTLGILGCASGLGGRLLAQAVTPELRADLEQATRTPR